MATKLPVTISPLDSGKGFHVLLYTSRWSEIKTYWDDITPLKSDMVAFLGYMPKESQIKFERMGEERIEDCLAKLGYRMR
jgi:hypothetical protein